MTSQATPGILILLTRAAPSSCQPGTAPQFSPTHERRSTIAAKLYGPCACGCDQRCTTASGKYIPAHVPPEVPARDSAGLWVEVKMGEEDPAYAYVSSTKEPDTLFVNLSLADHPTCGHCHLEIPQRTMLKARATQPPRGPRQ